jgi:Concanavalin A-like lectin/glucanases superfamily
MSLRKSKLLLAAASSTLIFGCAAAQDVVSGLVTSYTFDLYPRYLPPIPNTGILGVSRQRNISLVSGPRGIAASFDNSQSQIRASQTANLLRGPQLPNLNSPRTVAFWMNLTSADDGNLVSWGRVSENNRFSVYVGNDQTLQVLGTNNDYVSDYIVPLNTWVHIAVAYDGRALRFYADGVQVGATQPTQAFDTAPEELRLGVTPMPLEDQFYGGLLDEIYIYDRALSSTDISALVSLGATEPPPVETPASPLWSLILGAIGLAALVVKRAKIARS